MPDILFGGNLILAWLVALIVFIVIEAVTVNIVSVWFALGALAAMVACALNVSFPLQIIIFLAVSVITLLLTRPFVKKFVIPKKISTNFERIVGMEAQVTEKIDNFAEIGAVHVDGKEWSAKSDDGSVIDAGQNVKILRIEGVKVIVANK